MYIYLCIINLQLQHVPACSSKRRLWVFPSTHGRGGWGGCCSKTKLGIMHYKWEGFWGTSLPLSLSLPLLLFLLPFFFLCKRLLVWFVCVHACVCLCVCICVYASMCIMDFYPSQSTAVTVCLTPHGLYYARRSVYQWRHTRPTSALCISRSLHTLTNTYTLSHAEQWPLPCCFFHLSPPYLPSCPVVILSLFLVCVFFCD